VPSSLECYVAKHCRFNRERERERGVGRLLASVVGSSVPSVFSLNRQHTFKKLLVTGRWGYLLRTLNRKTVGSRKLNWVTDNGSCVRVRKRYD
jgi:hypothetical protein